MRWKEINQEIKREQWKEHFRRQYDGEEEEEESGLEKEEEEGENQREEFRESETTKKEIIRVIRKLKRKKAAGPDGIKNEAWKAGLLQLIDPLHEYINIAWKREKFPRSWKEGVVKPIFKKGEEDKVENYRGIVLMDTGYTEIKKCSNLLGRSANATVDSNTH